MNEPILVTVLEAAEMLGLGRSTIYELFKSGEIKFVRIGKAVRVPVHEVREYVQRLEAETFAQPNP
jgi:excisionase family DNA binding protein